MAFDFDAIVIGAGSGGLTAAIGLSKVGKKVLLVERDKMGGECTNTGCIPSKTLIHLSRDFSRGSSSLSQKKIFDAVRKKVDHIRSEESPAVLEKEHGVKVELGTAQFQDRNTILVQNKKSLKTFTARYIVIATGSSPRTVDIPGLDPKYLLTNENLFELEREPKKLLVLGGGAIGCEMAEALSRLGSQVTMVTNAKTLLPREEPEAAEYTEEKFQKVGIEIIHQAALDSCDGKTAYIKITATEHAEMKSVAFDAVLMGIGRVPNVKDLNLEAAGIAFNEKGIQVNRHNQTSSKNIFAVGDVSSAAKFTHMADDQARHVVKKILLGLVKASSKKPVPRVTYLEDEVASVGMTYREACRKYGARSVFKILVPYDVSDRAKTDEVSGGIAMVIARRISGRMLGATLVGRSAGELLTVFTLSIQERISMWRLNRVIIPYPILGQLYKKLSDQFVALTFHHLKGDLKHLFKRHFPKLVALVFWSVLLLSFYRYKTQYDLSSLDIARDLFTFITSTTYGPLLYIIVYALRPLIFFPATLLTLLSGALFGLWGGIFYTIIGENMSANLAYWIGRFFGSDLIDEESTGLLSTWQQKLQENGFISVLIMRFIYIPFDLVNYGCGVLGVGWRAYFLATFIGILPGLITFVSFGASLENIHSFDLSQISFNPVQFIFSIALFAASLVLAHAVKKHHNKAA